MSTILVVDDKESLRDSVGFTLQRAGFTILAASSGSEALDTVARKRPDCVVTDLKMPGMTGVELIEKLNSFDDELPAILMTAYGTVETAVKAMKLGAFDYITKPFEGDELIIAVKRALDHAAVRRENAVLRASGDISRADGDAGDRQSRSASRGSDRIIGSSAVMMELKSRLKAVARSQGTVLVTGDSGTGKEVIARAIHEMSDRADSPFLAVNCAAMSESLLESELFGHEKGAFTGAESLRKGRFELAHGGTLLLDEISEVRPQVQAKLLRVLQEQAFERVGSSQTIGVDVRIIATTNRDLADEVSRGAFRQDLFYRLNVLPLHLPPLRERSEDVRRLAPHFVKLLCEREGRGDRRFTAEAMDMLANYPWPGNVRELENLCERAVVLSPTPEIGPELIRSWLTGPGAPGRAQKARPKAMGSVEGQPSAFAAAHAAAGANGDGNGNGNGHLNGAAASMLGDGEFNGRALHASPRPPQNAASFATPGAAKAMIEPRPLADIEREVIIETLQRFNGHRQKTAKALGIGVRTLGLKLKKWKEQQLVSPTL
jgi:DNA-binding NtrC family response regulator